jgi:hypothetical protein
MNITSCDSQCRQNKIADYTKCLNPKANELSLKKCIFNIRKCFVIGLFKVRVKHLNY